MSSTQPKSKTRSRHVWRSLAIVFALYFLPVGVQVAAYYAGNDRDTPWWELRRDSSEQAPDPFATDDAIIQVYAARAVRWRGALGVHTWIATKRSNEDFYTRLEVMGYALRWSDSSVQIRQGQPDRYWYGSKPTLLREVRGGNEVDSLINDLHQLANDYSVADQYKVWPGPNSNTFVAHLARQVPELNVDLPPTAVGKDYRIDGQVIGTPPSGSGLQLSVGGLIGLIVSPEEGIEINLLGLTAGIDLSPLALKLPAIGRIGYADSDRNHY